MLLTWAGYSVGLWGWCLLRGYDVTLGQLMSPTHPYGSGKGQGWPPQAMPDTQVFPGGPAAASSSSPASSSSSAGGNAAAGLPAPSGRLGPGGTVVK
jgi:hypothetical protein